MRNFLMAGNRRNNQLSQKTKRKVRKTNVVSVPDLDNLPIGTENQSIACYFSATINPEHVLHRKSITEIFEGKVPGSTDIIQKCMSCRSAHSIRETI